MKAYKGFNKDFACDPTGEKPFAYAVGQTYKTDRAEPCKSGFHACADPLAVLRYYPAGLYGARFAEVILSGEIKTEGDKSCATEITIVKEITLSELIAATVAVRTEAAREAGRLETASGYGGAATASGERGAATASGYGGKARGAVGCVLFLVERAHDGAIINHTSLSVDGEQIKPMIYYTLRDGKVVPA